MVYIMRVMIFDDDGILQAVIRIKQNDFNKNAANALMPYGTPTDDVRMANAIAALIEADFEIKEN
jgi:hypothetical protein